MFTQENVEKLEKFYSEISKLEDEFTTQYSLAIEGAKERKHTINRNEKDVEVTEDTLWYETNNLGANCDAGAFLKEKYPQVFELAEKQNTLTNEMHEFSLKELNINPTKIRMIDIIKIAQGVSNLK